MQWDKFRDKWMTTRVNPVLGVVISFVCGMMGGFVIVAGSPISSWFVLPGAFMIFLAMWSLTVSVMKINENYAKRRTDLD